MPTLTTNSPWARKHDDVNVPVVPAAPTTYYPKDRQEIKDIINNISPQQRLHAAGSHWALSDCAISDEIFIESHDPKGLQQAMGKTLTNVLLNARTLACTNFFKNQVIPTYPHPSPFSGDPSKGGAIYPVHIESGKRIYQLYAELDSMQGDVRKLASDLSSLNPNYLLTPWAFRTLGGAGGQTVLGALSTGTHGGDFDRPPLADAVMAIHLIAGDGKEYWIEPNPIDSLMGVQLTDDAALGAIYPGIIPKRDTTWFQSVLVGNGRFGVVYSLVMAAVPHYDLLERRELDTWQEIRARITDPYSDLFTVGPNAFPARFLQIAVNHVPCKNFTTNVASVTKRATCQAPAVFGREERVGFVVEPFNNQIQAPRFSQAGNNHAFSFPGGKSPNFFEMACADSNFVVGIFDALEQELEDFVASNGTLPSALALGAALPVVASTVLATLPLLVLALVVRMACAKPIKDILKSDILSGPPAAPTLGSLLGSVADQLLHGATPDEKKAGLFIWQSLSNKIFKSMQEPHTVLGISYAIMDTHDYLEHSCNANVDSIEVFFNAVDPMLPAFVDAMLAYEKWQEIEMERSHIGYVALRFMQPSAAKIAPQQIAYPSLPPDHPQNRVCSVEISGLRGGAGTTPFIDYAISLALNPNFNAILHWGQRNPSTRPQIEQRFGQKLLDWRGVLNLIAPGSSQTFSNSFTRQTGLETP
jgi:hypothetical protein